MLFEFPSEGGSLKSSAGNAKNCTSCRFCYGFTCTYQLNASTAVSYNVLSHSEYLSVAMLLGGIMYIYKYIYCGVNFVYMGKDVQYGSSV